MCDVLESDSFIVGGFRSPSMPRKVADRADEAVTKHPPFAGGKTDRPVKGRQFEGSSVGRGHAGELYCVRKRQVVEMRAASLLIRKELMSTMLYISTLYAFPSLPYYYHRSEGNSKRERGEILLLFPVQGELIFSSRPGLIERNAV